MTRAFGLLALGACANVPDPPDFGPDLVSVTRAAGGLTVRGPLTVANQPLFEMSFPSPTEGVPMPDSLKVGDRETLRLAPDGCNSESRIGVALFPAGVAVSGALDPALTVADAGLETLVEAPGMVKVSVTYAVDYTCPDPETLSGQTVFTFFPSGRIVRQDLNIKPSTDPLDPGGQAITCGCAPAEVPRFFFTSFYAFDDAGVQLDANDTMPPADNTTKEACTMFETHGVGVSWPTPNVRYRPNAAASHVFDFEANASTVSNAPRTVTSAIQVHDGPHTSGTCAQVLAQLADLPIRIGDERLLMTANDGIYRPTKPHASETEIRPDGTAIPGSFAVSINLGGARHADVYREPDRADFYRIHRDPETPGNFVFVFLDGLEEGESITIEPQS